METVTTARHIRPGTRLALYIQRTNCAGPCAVRKHFRFTSAFAFYINNKRETRQLPIICIWHLAQAHTPYLQHYARLFQTITALRRLKISSTMSDYGDQAQAYQRQHVPQYTHDLAAFRAQPVVNGDDTPFKFLALPVELRNAVYHRLMRKLEIQVRPYKQYRKANINRGIKLFFDDNNLTTLASTCQQIYGEIDAELLSYAILTPPVKLVAEVQDFNFKTFIQLLKFLGNNRSLPLINAAKQKLVADLIITDAQSIDQVSLGKWFKTTETMRLDIEYRVSEIERVNDFIATLVQVHVGLVSTSADMPQITEAVLQYKEALTATAAAAAAAEDESSGEDEDGEVEEADDAEEAENEEAVEGDEDGEADGDDGAINFVYDGSEDEDDSEAEDEEGVQADDDVEMGRDDDSDDLEEDL
ncbi:hypothetical protein LTR17_013901 [Elasticomyces elasticus]|nr:hypothetical protein LTR17_013901 [Elasticomyces elasticus]